jgi:hypothetical protein
MMPGIYAADRDAGAGKAGLQLPFTPTAGPLRFGQDLAGYLDVPMHDCYSGAASAVTGLQTHLISECAVFITAEFKQGKWGNVYFAHVQGGDWSGLFAFGAQRRAKTTREALEAFAASVNVTDCYSVIVVPSDGSAYSSFGAFPEKLGFPASKLSVYISNTIGGLGVAAEFRYMGEFGEIDTPGAKKNATGPFGLRSLKPSFTDWEA